MYMCFIYHVSFFAIIIATIIIIIITIVIIIIIIYIIYIFNIYCAIKMCQLDSLLITPAGASPYTHQQLCMQTLKTVMHASCSWMLVDAPAGVDSRTGRLSCLTAHADYIMYKLGSYSVSPWKQLSMCAPGCRLGRLLL